MKQKIMSNVKVNEMSNQQLYSMRYWLFIFIELKMWSHSPYSTTLSAITKCCVVHGIADHIAAIITYLLTTDYHLL